MIYTSLVIIGLALALELILPPILDIFMEIE